MRSTDRLVGNPRTRPRICTSINGRYFLPATAEMKKRLIWAEVCAIGPNVRTMEVGDQVLFSPEDRYEVEVRGDDYIILRERDIHAVAASRLEETAPGLYL